MKTIFIVDDNDTNLMMAKNALDGVYKTYALPSAQSMFKLAEKITPDLILLDVDMPEIDGFEAIWLLKSDVKLKSIPVVFLTAKHDAESEVHGFEMGALDFISKPFSPPVLIKRIEMHIETDRIIKESHAAVRETHNATISVIADMVENRDKVTGGHIERTQIYLEILVNKLLSTGTYAKEMASWDLSLLLPSAQLHDVGKIAISDIILNKPGKLTDEEFLEIQRHCSYGEHIIEQIIMKTRDDVFLHHAKMFAAHHHEKWNGKGYPRNLAGENIPLQGRIMAIADVYDALVCERPYKKPFPHEKAVEIIKNDSGTHFDPKIVDIFLEIADDFNGPSVKALINASKKESI
ncbi:MAG: response regulator [Chitinispirillia bacterium]|nr:response regulator [Chitinispirillia bacterium]